MRFSMVAALSSVLALGCGDDGMPMDAGMDAASCGDCDDGVFCNGEETCVDGMCMAGTAPCAGECDEDGDRCVEGCTDADGDGDCAIAEGGTDCDDEDPSRYAGATEVCDSAGVDEDCDLTTLGTDGDGDGYYGVDCCNTDGDSLICGTDCNDASMEVNPEAEEICDERDNDCDGTSDEGVQMVYYRDADSDNYGLDTDTVLACSLPTGGYTVRGGDCDDDLFDDDPGDPPANERNPGRTEICNTVDDDCDGIPDPTDCACTEPDTRTCAEAGFQGACAVGNQTCTGGTWAGCPAPASNESCGGGDEDCDGVTDEPGADGSITCWADADGDGFASAGALTMELCACTGNWTDEDPATNADCDDGDPDTYPGATELCDRKLNDCSNTSHMPSSEDADDDGFASLTAACTGGFPRTDCDDGRDIRNPMATYQDEPVCGPGTNALLCPISAGVATRCLETRCPSSCEVSAGVAPGPGGCPTGTQECTCGEAPTRCLTEGSSCVGCKPTDGVEPYRDDACRSNEVRCTCYDQWETSCETGTTCGTIELEDVTPPDVWDFNCSGDDDLAPDTTGFSCMTDVRGNLRCTRSCAGSICSCPDAIYDGGTRQCGGPGHTVLTCSGGVDSCTCREDSTGATLPCR